eukprot:751645-Hanusia_phi.AAC.4
MALANTTEQRDRAFEHSASEQTTAPQRDKRSRNHEDAAHCELQINEIRYEDLAQEHHLTR